MLSFNRDLQRLVANNREERRMNTHKRREFFFATMGIFTCPVINCNATTNMTVYKGEIRISNVHGTHSHRNDGELQQPYSHLDTSTPPNHERKVRVYSKIEKNFDYFSIPNDSLSITGVLRDPILNFSYWK